MKAKLSTAHGVGSKKKKMGVTPPPPPRHLTELPPTTRANHTGMIVEVLSALTMGLSRAKDAAASAWNGLRSVYPRGCGMGYSHLGGVGEGLRR